MNSPEIRKATSCSKGSFGQRQDTCVFCKKKINKHRIMKILVSHSPKEDGSDDLQVASFKYKIPLCEEHSGITNKNEQKVRVKLSWEEENA